MPRTPMSSLLDYMNESELTIHRLRRFMKNPLDYYMTVVTRQELEPGLSDDQIFGLMFAEVLLQRNIDDSFYVVDAGDRRVKAWKEGKQAAINAGKIPVLQKDVLHAQSVARTFAENDKGRYDMLVNDSVRLCAIHSDGCSARPAAIPDSAGTVWTVKVVKSLDDAERVFWNARWDLTAMWNCIVNAAEECGGISQVQLKGLCMPRCLVFETYYTHRYVEFELSGHAVQRAFDETMDAVACIRARAAEESHEWRSATRLVVDRPSYI